MQHNPRYPKLDFKYLGKGFHYWKKSPTNGEWKGICAVKRHTQKSDNTKISNDKNFITDFQEGKIKGTAKLISHGNDGDITITASFSIYVGDGANLFGNVTINTPTPVVCDITCGVLLEKGFFGYFDSLDRSGNGNKDSDGNSYTGSFVAYPPDE